MVVLPFPPPEGPDVNGTLPPDRDDVGIAAAGTVGRADLRMRAIAIALVGAQHGRADVVELVDDLGVWQHRLAVDLRSARDEREARLHRFEERVPARRLRAVMSDLQDVGTDLLRVMIDEELLDLARGMR